MTSLALAFLFASLPPAPVWDKPWPEHPAPAINPAQLAELHRHQVDEFHCPASGAPGFKGMTQDRAREVLGEPDPTPRFIRPGKGGSAWLYYLTRGRDTGVTGPGNPPNAYFTLWFDRNGSLDYVGCSEKNSPSGSLTWTVHVGSTEPKPVRPKQDPSPASREISALLYSTLTREQILAGLSRYVVSGMKLKRFEKQTGIDGLCIGSGPGYMHCIYPEEGLQLVVDARGRIRLIRRLARTVDGTDHPEMSITESVVEDDGYYRSYEN